jgi:hypothetical protein
VWIQKRPSALTEQTQKPPSDSSPQHKSKHALCHEQYTEAPQVNFSVGISESTKPSEPVQFRPLGEFEVLPFTA